MRVLLFTGKGGVGKTTLAAASALRLVEAGQKVLVCSTDPAHSLADALQRSCDDEPGEVEPGLYGMQLDARRLLRTRWPAAQDALAELVGSVPLLADELTVLPGVEEMLALAEVRRLVRDGPWDALVLDCGPTAETLRMLAWPEAVAGYVEQSWPRHRRAVARGAAVAAVNRLQSEASAVAALLTDRSRCSVRLVCTPQRVVAAETRRTLTALSLHGMHVDGVLVNRVLPAAGAEGGSTAQWLRESVTGQQEVVAALRAAVAPDLPVELVGERAQEPVGPAALLELGAGLDPPPPPRGSDAASVEIESGSGLTSVWAWTIPLLLAQDAEVELARLDDDVLLTVDGLRRRLPLPPLLRRCEIVDAEVGPGRLVVRCVPDPALWSR